MSRRGDLNPVSVRDTGRDLVEDLEEVVEDIVAVVGPCADLLGETLSRVQAVGCVAHIRVLVC